MEAISQEIKKLFVSFEIAMLLKDKGFDEEVIATYDTEEEKELFIFAFSVLNKGVFEQGFKKGWCIKAPTYQQVIDWLRIKHKYFVGVRLYGNSFKQRYVALSIKNLNPNQTTEIGEYDDYNMQ